MPSSFFILILHSNIQQFSNKALVNNVPISHLSQGLPHAAPRLAQHSDLRVAPFILTSQRPSWILSQQVPLRLSINEECICYIWHQTVINVQVIYMNLCNFNFFLIFDMIPQCTVQYLGSAACPKAHFIQYVVVHCLKNGAG